MTQPTSTERVLIARCLLNSGELIGSVDEIWSHPNAYRALETWQLCIDVITDLIGGGHAVVPSFIKACVMQTDGLRSAPFCLDDIAEFMVDDSAARLYWDSLTNDDHYPHRCPHCKCAAYIGMNQIDCKARCLPQYQ